MSIISCLSCTRVCSQGSLPGPPSVSQLGKVVGVAPAPPPGQVPPDQAGALFPAEHCHLAAPGPQLSCPCSSPTQQRGSRVFLVCWGRCLLSAGKDPARRLMSRSSQRSFGPTFLKLWSSNLHCWPLLGDLIVKIQGTFQLP